ncbi:hypothetical protein [Tissierella sp.]|uniref:hypothetical protein n=1 Tax=Tissierella sp. TaxID=41274 RepID=UPI0028603C90|nr:hypothetical protein [Tissierella sp.]MDR7857886.1 hypothetical protein [Tissierella sp.]
MRRKSMLILLLLLLMLITISCKNEEYSKHTFHYEYVTGEQYFSFEYPQNWEIEEDKASKGNGLPDGTPDFGITIYMDSEIDNIIYIFEGISPNMYWEKTYEEDDFIVDGTTRGKIYSQEERDTIYKVITFDRKDDGEDYSYRYVLIQAEKKFYNTNEKRIKNILESIEF